MQNQNFEKYKMFIFTQDADKLIDFYTTALELEVVGKLELPNDYGYSIRVAPGYDIWIANHDKVSGKNKDIYRHMLNLYTDKVHYYFEKVKKYPGCHIIQEPTAMSAWNPDEKSRSVCTFTDPDGNIVQIMGKL